jgi:hypothetical protein
MPYTWSGVGTTYYGRRDKAVDGSYVTTKFVVIFFVPVIPLSSWRVLPVGERRFRVTGFSMGYSQNYQATRVPFSWRQVLNIYLALIGVVLLAVFLRRLYPPSLKFPNR